MDLTYVIVSCSSRQTTRPSIGRQQALGRLKGKVRKSWDGTGYVEEKQKDPSSRVQQKRSIDKKIFPIILAYRMAIVWFPFSDVGRAKY